MTSPTKGLKAEAFRYVGLFCLVFWTVVGLAVVLAPVLGYSDYVHYLKIVNGDIADVRQPFVSRVFGPEIARLLMRGTGWSPSTALTTVCLAGWAVAPLAGGLLLYLRKTPLTWALVVASVPFAALAARFFQVPDGWAVSFVLTLFIGLELASAPLAGAGAVALAFARSSSLMSVLLQLAAGYRKGRWRIAAVVLAAFAIGLVARAPLIHGNPGNQHRMPGLVYLLAKAPVNGLSNLFGVHIYTNTYPYCPKPATVLELGRVPGLGDIHTVGLCSGAWRPILTSVLCYAAIFGVFPALALRRLLSPGPLAEKAADPSWRELAAFLAMHLLSPAFGLTITRLFVEAYPLLFIAAGPAVRGMTLTRGRAVVLMGLNIAAFVILMSISPN